jgi:hypothetical protein
MENGRVYADGELSAEDIAELTDHNDETEGEQS